MINCQGIEHKYPFKFPLNPGRKPRTDNLGPMCYVVESIPAVAHLLRQEESPGIIRTLNFPCARTTMMKREGT